MLIATSLKKETADDVFKAVTDRFKGVDFSIMLDGQSKLWKLHAKARAGFAIDATLERLIKTFTMKIVSRNK